MKSKTGQVVKVKFSPARELSDIDPEQVKWSVQEFLPEKGLVLLYGPSSVGKTYLGLQVATEMLRAVADTAAEGRCLFSHPALDIHRPWGKVLWISTEETGGQLHTRWDNVRAGLGGVEEMKGLLFKWGSDPKEPITLDQLGAVLKVQADSGQLPQAIILDSLTGL